MDYEHHYQWLVSELCIRTGVSDIPAVLAGRHILMNDGLVGFAPDLAHDGTCLSIFVELSLTDPELDGLLYEKLLIQNMDSSNGLKGAFSLHPESHYIVYRVRVDLRDIADGEAFEKVLAAEQQVARENLESLATM